MHECGDRVGAVLPREALAAPCPAPPEGEKRGGIFFWPRRDIWSRHAASPRHTHNKVRLCDPTEVGASALLRAPGGAGTSELSNIRMRWADVVVLQE